MTAIEGGGVVLLPGEGRLIDEAGFSVTVLADAAQTDSAFSLRTGMSPEDLDAIADRYAMEIVGPLPPGYL